MRTSQINDKPPSRPSVKKTIWSRRGTGTFIDKSSQPQTPQPKTGSQSILVKAENLLEGTKEDKELTKAVPTNDLNQINEEIKTAKQKNADLIQEIIELKLKLKDAQFKLKE